MAFEINMPSVLETQINDAFLTMHRFFADRRPLFYSFGQNQELLIADNPNNNYFFGANPDNATVISTPTTGTFRARVYDSVNDLDGLYPNDNNVRQPYGTIDIVVESDGRDLLQQCVDADKRVVYNGQTYRVSTESANHGLLARPFFDFRLSVSQ